MCINVPALIEKNGRIAEAKVGKKTIKVFNFIQAKKGDYVYLQGNSVVELIEKGMEKETIRAWEQKKKKKLKGIN